MNPTFIVVMPATAAAPTRDPNNIARETISSTAGPGTRLYAAVTARKSVRA
jgi:hypothetical protein